MEEKISQEVLLFSNNNLGINKLPDYYLAEFHIPDEPKQRFEVNWQHIFSEDNLSQDNDNFCNNFFAFLYGINPIYIVVFEKLDKKNFLKDLFGFVRLCITENDKSMLAKEAYNLSIEHNKYEIIDQYYEDFGFSFLATLKKIDEDVNNLWEVYRAGYSLALKYILPYINQYYCESVPVCSDLVDWLEKTNGGKRLSAKALKGSDESYYHLPFVYFSEYEISREHVAIFSEHVRKYLNFSNNNFAEVKRFLDVFFGVIFTQSPQYKQMLPKGITEQIKILKNFISILEIVATGSIKKELSEFNKLSLKDVENDDLEKLKNLNKLKERVGNLIRFGLKKPEDYEMLGAALLDTLNQVTKDFSKRSYRAWLTVYSKSLLYSLPFLPRAKEYFATLDVNKDGFAHLKVFETCPDNAYKLPGWFNVMYSMQHAALDKENAQKAWNEIMEVGGRAHKQRVLRNSLDNKNISSHIADLAVELSKNSPTSSPVSGSRRMSGWVERGSLSFNGDALNPDSIFFSDFQKYLVGLTGATYIKCYSFFDNIESFLWEYVNVVIDFSDNETKIREFVQNNQASLINGDDYINLATAFLLAVESCSGNLYSSTGRGWENIMTKFLSSCLVHTPMKKIKGLKRQNKWIKEHLPDSPAVIFHQERTVYPRLSATGVQENKSRVRGCLSYFSCCLKKKKADRKKTSVSENNLKSIK